LKHLIKSRIFKPALMLCFLMVTAAIALAQDSTVTSSKSSIATTETTTWYAEPWVWAVGGLVFILLIVALVKGKSGGSGRTDKVTVTKTTSTDVN
jgi:cell division protein FtsW (lipid II flippase)